MWGASYLDERDSPEASEEGALAVERHSRPALAAQLAHALRVDLGAGGLGLSLGADDDQSAGATFDAAGARGWLGRLEVLGYSERGD